jgi:hypothetical protein
MRIRAFGVVLSLLLLGGCGKPAETGNADVATLRSDSPVSASPSVAGRERPVIRPDEGKEEFDRYVAIWAQCIRDQGINVASGEKPSFEDNDASRAARKKCEHLYPEHWMERERRTNPQFVDLLRKTAQCLLDKGHKVTVGGDPVAIRYGDNTSANKAYDDEQECQRKVFKDSIDKYNQR